MVAIVERMAIRDWSIEAQNGDHQDIRKGQTYTTIEDIHDDNTITVFSRFWVRVPLNVFQLPTVCPHCKKELP